MREANLVRIGNRISEFRKWAALAKGQTGKAFITQLREIRSLKVMGGQCGLSDYYWYRLYDEEYQLGRGAPDYLGWRLQQELSLALNPRVAVLPAWDKRVFVQLADSVGLPVAPIRACFNSAKNLPQSLGRHLRTKEDVGHFLRDPSIYPMFGKPAYSQQGYGADYFTGYDPTTDSLGLLDKPSVMVQDFLGRMDRSVDVRYHRPECGYLFQDALLPAPEICALTGRSAICGVRIVCLNGRDGVKPIRAVWKIAVKPNHIDNFSKGRYGNLIANIDLTTGVIDRVVNGFWPDAEIKAVSPGTHNSFKGFKLPGWNEVLQACSDAGAAFPLMRIHHWDFALTHRGPQILELNDLGATEFLQLHGHGLISAETCAFLKANADTKRHSWILKLRDN